MSLSGEGEIIATGAYKPKDRHTAEIKRIWTHRRLRQQGLAAKVVQELERRAVLAGYSHIYLTTGFRQPEAVKLYLSQGYEAQFDLTRDRKSTVSRRTMAGCGSLKRWPVSAYSHSA
ncbi:N-acetyltransferase GCN5 [Klebsiella pneumoniae]|uniref:N-acetyltransferase GCN5 n=1 Tax=Klebsiella pneumoniae TaxID=573 RepID=A0A2X3F3U1_KLEPN|nr:N-acetyltransferase GCN5 [Klebsiella pneumoniae]